MRYLDRTEMNPRVNGFNMPPDIFEVFCEKEEAPLTEPARIASAFRGYIPPTHLDKLAPASRRLHSIDAAVTQMIAVLGIPEDPVSEERIAMGLPQLCIREDLVRAILFDMMGNCDCHAVYEDAEFARANHMDWPHLVEKFRQLARDKENHAAIKQTYLAIREKCGMINLPSFYRTN